MLNSLDPDFSTEQAEAFRHDSFARIVQNAVSAQGADEVSLDRETVNRIDESTSERLDAWKATDQKKSGRCWAFAGLNVMRARIIAELGVEDFEFSENYVAFYDKLEKANHVLVRAIETAGVGADDEAVRRILESTAPDGGMWHQFTDLVRKYSVVPEWAMPDTESSGNTLQLNRAISTSLRRAVGRIREAGAAQAASEEMDAIRTKAMQDVWRVLAIHLGTPPESFVWQYRDKEKNFHSEGSLTPREFAERYVTEEIADYVVLGHDPREENPVGRNYASDNTPYMIGGTPYSHVSAPIEDLKAAAVAAIRAGEPVWFTCDVKKQFDKNAGIWDAKLHDYDALYGVGLDISKADRLRLRETSPSHAMTLVGVDLVDGQPRRWRVENSWGDSVGNKGFFTMDDSWFDEYVFHVAISPEHATEAQRAAAAEKPIVLPEWDMLG
ncbi:aminopeptidase C [Ancrocorticia populi]|uniref:Aminopeptidase n=1 Tax=Ancrocorticia populi TaxID=2175228 RepID=A0A2V1K5I4_9ACTO|nr:C1 family peptidase [Ancrocorticia populi]PWF26564.1 aminopeptidase [Ancrocorticia populi]